MKYNEKYDIYVDDDLVIYRWDDKKDKLMQCKQSKNNHGYLFICTKLGHKGVHRVLWETFNGEIPQGYELDHINTVTTDNRIENLRCVTHKENMNNPLSKRHASEAMKGKANSRSITHSEFGNKFKEHYGITFSDNQKLYDREKHWYNNHNKTCRWESDK